MSLTIPFAGRRNRRRHSPDAVIRQLRDENIKLLARQAEADDYFALLAQDRDETYQAWQQEKQLRVEAEIDAGLLQSEMDDLLDEIDLLRKQLAPYRAAEANAHRVTVPSWVRPISGPEEEATAPIDVRPLWAAREAGLLGASHATTH